MRKKIITGNWKMNKSYDEGIRLASDIIREIASINPADVTIVLCPPYIHLHGIASLLKDSNNIFLGAQNCSAESEGAFTGEISAEMIRSAGGQYVVIGHSERRAYFSEDSTMLIKKTNLALANNLTPIFCCGETLVQRKTNVHFDVINVQLKEVLFHLNEKQISEVIIAYEPIWAIGTGENATPEQAQEMHAFIRKIFAVKYGDILADRLSILYGGSCKPDNAMHIFVQPDVDGGLIGGASLLAKDFIKIIQAAC